jgi:SAM-dependent methyltransferase
MEWWRDMFTSAAWQAVQLAWETDADDADDDVHHVWHALALSPGARVLDVPCGTGRIAARLAERGCRPFGIDAVEAFARVAADRGVPVVVGDMRTAVTRPRSVDAAVSWWGSFGYFDEEGDRAQAAAAAEALVPGGRYLIDVPVADTVLPAFEPEASWEVGGVAVHEARAYDEDTRRIDTTWTFTREGARESRTTSVRLYTVVELMELLSDVGFSTFQALDGDLLPFQAGAERLRLVAATPD